MSNEIGWHHPVDESDQWDGFNEPGIETFAGRPIRNLAREVNQNSLDAGESDLVDVRICLHQVDTSTIPNLDEFRATLEACYKVAQKESKKAQVFFHRALNELENTKIYVLEVSDFNTNGMVGPSTYGSPFYAFMKASGQSRKDSDTATGSYGIGKFAPYAASNIRAVFVSTVYQDDQGKYHQLTQGKAILMSHDVNGHRKQGVGFWGIKEKCKPFEGISPSIPEWIIRARAESDMKELKGSKLTILCFEPSKNWEENLAVSVAENFFGAISDRKLRVDINGKYILDQTSIGDFLERSDIRKILEKQKDEPEQFDNTKSYLSALQNKAEVQIEENEMRCLGLCQVRILIGEGLRKKVCILRNGMFITDSLSRLKSFSDFKEFVAVVQCKSTKGNEILRAMEPPRHDDFEPDRLSTPEVRKMGDRALRDLAVWVRDMLKRHAKDPVTEVTEIDELREFFGDEGEDGSGEGTEEINPYGEIIIRAKPIKMKIQSIQIHEEGDGEGAEEGGEGWGGGSGVGGGNGLESKGSGQGGEGGGKKKTLVDINNVRSVPTGENKRIVSFTPVNSGRISLRMLAAGADTDYDLQVLKTDRGTVKNARVEMDVDAGSRVRLDVELNQRVNGAIKVVAYEL